jgi:hypothetical protein
MPPRKDEDYGKGLGVLIVDVNGDGRPDIYVANDTSGNFLYINQTPWGKGAGIRLKEMGTDLLVTRDGNGVPNGSMGVDAADYDGSSLASIWVTNYEGELHSLYRNQMAGGRLTFNYSTQVSGISVIGQKFVGFGTAFLDLDNHGREDIVVSNGHVIRFPPPPGTLRQKPVLLRNMGGGRFRKISNDGIPYFQDQHIGRGLVVGDLNNDGRPDLVISHLNEPVAVLANTTAKTAPNNHWLGVELKGRDHRDFVGAKLTLRVGGRRLTKFAKGGGSYLSSGDRRFLFGLGEAKKVGALTVEWPSGAPRKQTWSRLRVDRYHKLVQGVKEPQPPTGAKKR